MASRERQEETSLTTSPLPIRADEAESSVLQSARRTGAVEASCVSLPYRPLLPLPSLSRSDSLGMWRGSETSRLQAGEMQSSLNSRLTSGPLSLVLGKCVEQKEQKGQLEIVKENKMQDKNGNFKNYSMVQFSSVAQLCPTLCNPMNHSTPGLPVHHQLPEFTQTHVH